MKLYHTLVYSILSFFISTTVFSQDQSNTKKGTGTVSTNGVAGCPGGGPVLPAIGGGTSSVCISGITPAFTNSYAGGTWSIVNGTGTATIYNSSTGTWNRASGLNGAGGGGGTNGQVKGLTSGQVQVVYSVLYSGTTCYSRVYTNLNVIAIPTVSITESNSICIGTTTQLSPTTGGVWVSSNPAVAMVNNAGVVTGVTAGTATFIFTATGGCASLATPSVTVKSLPVVAGINGYSSYLCVDSNVTLTNTTPGGFWSVTNGNAEIDLHSGVLLGKQPGYVQSSYTVSSNGCSRTESTSPILIKAMPIVSTSGPSNAICVNGTVQLYPMGGGTWVASNPAVANVSNTGLVTGVSEGAASFTFTEANGCASRMTITVLTRPVASITGPNAICINGTTQLSPTTGGSWVSSNPAVATVNNAGVVKGVSTGTATFTFTLGSGICASLATPPVTINTGPTVSIVGSNAICIGATTQLSPTTGGTWTSNNTAVATVNNTGMVMGVSAGTATFSFTQAGGCTSLATPPVAVSTLPTASIIGSNAICISTTTQLSPTTGGTWTSSNTAVAMVDNTGLVTGVSAGTATFTFTATGGCASLATPTLTVNASPAVSPIAGGATTICIGSTTRFANTTVGGVWSITNGTGSATIDNTGLVTGVTSGTVRVNYTVDNGTCKSYATPLEITINATIGSSIDGPDAAFIGCTDRLYRGYPAGGTWSVRNVSGAATIQMFMGGHQNNELLGVLSEVATGTIKVIYTYNDPCGSRISLEKEVTILESCTLNNPNALIVKDLYEKLLSHLYGRARKGDTNAQINGSTPAELIALRPYIKNSLADKIYNFNYSKYVMSPYTESLTFSFSPGDIVNNDVQITNGGMEDYMTTYISYNTVSQNSYYTYYGSGTDGNVVDKVQFYAIKNIDFCPSAICAPMSGSIKTSIASPTTADSINFSLETTATNVTYNWTFKELDNVTPKGSATTPAALQTFSIPGNYRVLLFAKDGNGCEGNFYTDVIVKQTCVPIVGKIKILTTPNSQPN